MRSPMGHTMATAFDEKRKSTGRTLARPGQASPGSFAAKEQRFGLDEPAALAALREVLSPDGLAGIPAYVTEKGLTKLLAEARNGVVAFGDPLREGYCRVLHGFFEKELAGFTPALRHFKAFDPDNQGLIERRTVAGLIRSSYGRGWFGAHAFAAGLFWAKMHRFEAIRLNEVLGLSSHASGTKNWTRRGDVDEQAYAANRDFLANFSGGPWSLDAFRALGNRHAQPSVNPGSSSSERWFGKISSRAEMTRFFLVAGTTLSRARTRIISETVYRWSVDGYGLLMALNPKDLAHQIFAWKKVGVALRHPYDW